MESDVMRGFSNSLLPAHSRTGYRTGRGKSEKVKKKRLYCIATGVLILF
jgi:hypothetical protein